MSISVQQIDAYIRTLRARGVRKKARDSLRAMLMVARQGGRVAPFDRAIALAVAGGRA